jgi:hypothetical protein
MKIFKTINKMKLGIFLSSLIFLTFSCEDYLEEEALTDISADFVYNTAEGLETGVIGLYNFNRQIYENGRHEWFSSIMLASRSDLALNRAGVLSLFGRYIWGVSQDGYQATPLMSTYWQHYYKIADRANAIIKGAEGIEMDETQKNIIIAQAKFFRAHSYFTLYRMFNNIYVSEEPSTPENAFDVINDLTPKDEIFQLLNSDLQFAIDHLEWETNDFGKVTQGVARHIKAKVAMWEDNWDEAKLQSETIINQGPYSLLPNTGDVFTGDLNHSESIFTIQYSEGTPGGSSLSMINFNFIPRYEKVDGAKLTEEYGGKGGGFLMPNNYLLGLLAEDPNDNRDDDNYFRLKYYYNDGDNLPDGINLGDEIDVYAPTTDPDNPSDTNAKYYERIHPSCIKFVQEDADPLSQMQISNIMVYRLSETYLIAAEANMRTGGDALTYINAIRVRAGAAEITNVDEQAILDERARELAFEGQRWYTLKRMGVLQSQIIQYAGDDYYKTEPRANFLPHFENFPIPQSQLNLLGPNFPQNDGY